MSLDEKIAGDYNASKVALEKSVLYRKGIRFSAIRSTVAIIIKEMTGNPVDATEAFGQKDPKVTLRNYIAVFLPYNDTLDGSNTGHHILF